MELEKVIEEARQGNKNALELLYNAYRLKMRGVCIKILKDEREVVDDIVHDAFILAFTSLNKLKNPNKFGHDVFMFQIDNKSGKLLPMGER